MTRPHAAPAISLDEALDDPKIFGPLFKGPSWGAWRTLIRAAEARPRRAGDLERFRTLSGRSRWPRSPAREVWVAAGRRAGKSRVMAAFGVHRAAFVDYRPFLAPGERATVTLLACDRPQARTLMRYVKGLLESVPMLARLIERKATESIDLANGVTIEIHTASFRATRGYTLAAAICDELAFWRDESSANPAAEILAALRPGLATIPGAMLLAISSPYARSGPLWTTYERHYGRDDSPEVLVIRAPTLELNPTAPKSLIARAYEEDPQAAAAEWGAEFRSDLEAFVSREVLDACVAPSRFELPRIEGRRYVAFTDPSGGSHDSMVLAIAHAEGTGDQARAVLDVVREVRPPFSPDAVAKDFAEVLGAYGVAEVEGDRYAGEWPRERFRVHGVEYRPADRTKSEIYRELLPALNARRVELLDLPRLRAQLLALERRTARGGKDSIDHPPRGADDVANACCGALLRVLRSAAGDEVGELDLCAEYLAREAADTWECRSC